MGLLAFSAMGAGTASAQVVISAFRVTGPSGGNDEFVEIQNTSSSPVNISGWKLRGCANSSPGNVTDRVSVPASVTLGAGQFYLFVNNTAGNGYSGATPGDRTYGSGFSNFTGSSYAGIRLEDGSGTTMDQVGSGPNSPCREGAGLTSPTAAPFALVRSQDTGDNAVDFISPASEHVPRNFNTPVGPASPTLSIASTATIAEPAGPLTIDVTLSAAAAADVTFDIATSDGSAQAGNDYTATSVTPATISAGNTTYQFVVPIIDDALVEGDETFAITISNVSANATLGNGTATVTIQSDDTASLPQVSFAAGDFSAQEGDDGDANPIVFTVNVVPAPLPGAPLTFDVEADGPGGTFTYAGPASVTVTDQTALPLTFTIHTVGNDVDGTDSIVELRLSNFSGADAGQVNPLTKTATIFDDDLPISEIFAIQGSGECSPLIPVCNGAANVSGPTVRTRANIVTAIAASGFFMQTPGARDDGDPMTSNGIFVFTASTPQTDAAQALAIGDEVEVIGNVAEYFNMTQIVVSTTRGPNHRILRSNTAQSLPAAIAFGENGIPSKDPGSLSCGGSNFECFEGMRVAIANGAVGSSNQRRSSDLYAEVYASPYGERNVREKGVLFGVPVPANSPAAFNWDGNPEIIELDADYLMPAHAGELPGGTRFSAEGVIGYDFGDYEFWPTTFTIVDGSDALIRPVPAASSNELTLGSFNAYRLCDAVDDRGTPGITAICAATVGLDTSASRVAHELGQISAYIRAVLNSPDVVALQEVENLSVLNALAAQIASDGGPAYAAYLVDGNDVSGIDVGYLVNTARVIDVQVEQLAADETWIDPESPAAPRLLHDRPPLLLTGSFIGNGRPFPFMAMNNHTRSRIGLETGNAASERTRAKRFTQAHSIATLVQNLQTAPETADVALFMLGDFNAYQFTDGYADVVGLIAGTYDNDENSCAPAGSPITCKLPGGQNIVVPPLLNAVLLLDEQDQYSYNFTEDFGAVQGSAGRDLAVNQVLDHALFNHVASPYVSGMAYGRGNVDASVQRHRVCNFRYRDLALCPQGPDADPPAPWQAVGSSDHDGLVLYVSPPRPDQIFSDGFED